MFENMIAVINYKMGNLESVRNMLKRIGAPASITSDIDAIEAAEKLILPGVGAFDAGMDNLRDLGLLEVIRRKTLVEKTPILGICLGMQLLTKKSEEGAREGMGFIDAETKKFDFSRIKEDLKIPHMGWNTVAVKKNNKLFKGLENDARFYFVHSYHVVCKDREDVAAVTNYGYDFASSVSRENVLGVQFHPEKSHRFGMELLKNFVHNY